MYRKNYEIAKELLENHYNKADTVREQLLLSCLKFNVPKTNPDLSNFVSQVINLKVYMSELKTNHEIDILAETPGRHLIRAAVHDMLPGDILEKYQTLTGVEYPTLRQFIGKLRKLQIGLLAVRKTNRKMGILILPMLTLRNQMFLRTPL